MESTIERRTALARELRVARPADGQAVRLEGYAAVYDRPSEDLGGFIEEVAAGAFADSLLTDDIRCQFNHDPNLLLGRNTARTLTLHDDARGLFFSVELPDTACARDLAVSVERGDVTQCSFSFRTLTDEWSLRDGKTYRRLIKCRLYDVGPCTFAAYADTSVAVRSRDHWAEQQRTAQRPRLCRSKLLGIRAQG